MSRTTVNAKALAPDKLTRSQAVYTLHPFTKRQLEALYEVPDVPPSQARKRGYQLGFMGTLVPGAHLEASTYMDEELVNSFWDGYSAGKLNYARMRFCTRHMVELYPAPGLWARGSVTPTYTEWWSRDMRFTARYYWSQMRFEMRRVKVLGKEGK